MAYGFECKRGISAALHLCSRFIRNNIECNAIRSDYRSIKSNKGSAQIINKNVCNQCVLIAVGVAAGVGRVKTSGLLPN